MFPKQQEPQDNTDPMIHKWHKQILSFARESEDKSVRADVSAQIKHSSCLQDDESLKVVLWFGKQPKYWVSLVESAEQLLHIYQRKVRREACSSSFKRPCAAVGDI